MEEVDQIGVMEDEIVEREDFLEAMEEVHEIRATEALRALFQELDK